MFAVGSCSLSVSVGWSGIATCHIWVNCDLWAGNKERHHWYVILTWQAEGVCAMLMSDAKFGQMDWLSDRGYRSVERNHHLFAHHVFDQTGLFLVLVLLQPRRWEIKWAYWHELTGALGQLWMLPTASWLLQFYFPPFMPFSSFSIIFRSIHAWNMLH